MISNTILVPLDGSPESNAALPLALTLARATGASIVLLRVMSHADPEATELATTNLRKIAHELTGSGISVTSAVRQGRVAEEILAEIQEQSAALVVMRTHARAGVERAFLGSVADQVLARCAVPVVLMRPGEHRIAGIHTLLVPVDGSPGGVMGLRAAVALARLSGASIKLVQVTVPVAMHAIAAYEYSGMGYYDAGWDDEAFDSATTYVDGLVAHLRTGGLSAEGEALMAHNAARGIVDSADKCGADLVVMSTRALTGPARTLLGSVANAVVRTANCPVLLVHRPENADPPHGVGSETTPVGVAGGTRQAQN
jgi:nucleotide-binding universal stress UspA family protein